MHHPTPWSAGGRTDLGNLTLLCPRHHTEVHLGIWAVEMRDGVPWTVPPAWIDPGRRPLRNTAHHAAQQARRVGQRLRLLLSDTASDSTLRRATEPSTASQPPTRPSDPRAASP